MRRFGSGSGTCMALVKGSVGATPVWCDSAGCSPLADEWTGPPCLHLNEHKDSVSSVTEIRTILHQSRLHSSEGIMTMKKNSSSPHQK